MTRINVNTPTRHSICLIIAVICVVTSLSCQPTSEGQNKQNPPNTAATKPADDGSQPMPAKADSPGLPRVKHERMDLAPLIKDITSKRHVELESLRNRPPLSASADSNMVHVSAGPYQPDLYVTIGGKIRPQEEALPQILEYLWQDDKEKLIEAVKALGTFQTSIADTVVIDRLIQLYRGTVSPEETIAFLLNKNEREHLQLKLAIILTIAASKDKRKDVVLEEAEKDINHTVRKLAYIVKHKLPYSPHTRSAADEVP